MNDVRKVVLAYSGGLDTSVILRWLIETYRCEVIAFAADIGQKEELSGLREKAIKTGAAKIYIDDLQEEFVRDFVFPALRANAIYEGTYLLGTSLARPLIAKRQLDTQDALVRQYEGTLKVDQAAIDSARLQLSYCRITAPVSGRLGLRQVDAGNMVHASDANGLVVITRLQPIAVVFAVPEDNVPDVMKRLQAGEKLPVDAYDRGVFFVGEDSEQQKHIDESMQRITKDYIVRIEKKGESCTK